MLTHIDLFSGIGGFALAAKWAGFETLAFVEIEPYAQEIIKQNFGAVADTAQCNSGESKSRGIIEAEAKRGLCEFDRCDPAPRPLLFSDIFTFDGAAYRGATLLTGGFPCQPFSQAGKRRGKEDDRYLWPEMLRVIHEARPAWVLGENVAGIVTMELDRVLSDLEGEGYAVQPLIIPACAVDAKHRRDRVWIVAHRDGAGQQQRRRAEPIQPQHAAAQCAGEIVGYAENRRIRRREASGNGRQPAQPSENVADAWDGWAGNSRQGWRREFKNGCEWEPEPGMGRVANGIPARVDRLKGLGNAIVPQVAYEIIREIARLESIE